MRPVVSDRARRHRLTILAGLGAVSLLLYGLVARIPNLRQAIPAFEIIYFALFALYIAAVLLALAWEQDAAAGRPPPRAALWMMVVSGVIFRAVLLPVTPTLSDDVYRYVWDGHVQAAGISPYRYPPNAPDLIRLRVQDQTIWPHFNRKSAVTIYPPAAQLAFRGIYALHPDSITWTKTAMALAELATIGLLAVWLRRRRRSPLRIVILAWSPLAVFEIAGHGHLDALILLPLVGALLARENRRAGWVGVCLGLVTLIKLYPALWLLAILPLLAADLSGGRWGLRFDAATGWLLFTGLVALSYTYFIELEPLPWAIWLQYLPLLFFLFVPPVLARTKKWFPTTRARPEGL